MVLFGLVPVFEGPSTHYWPNRAEYQECIALIRTLKRNSKSSVLYSGTNHQALVMCPLQVQTCVWRAQAKVGPLCGLGRLYVFSKKCLCLGIKCPTQDVVALCCSYNKLLFIYMYK